MNLEQIRPKAEEYYDKTIYEPCKEKHLVDDYGDPIVCEEDVIDAYIAGITENVNNWHYVKDKLPPNPKENEDGKSILPLDYICAYECGDDGCGEIDYECDVFTYLGNGEWLGENKRNYPIYAWMEYNVEVPKPIKEK